MLPPPKKVTTFFLAWCLYIFGHIPYQDWLRVSFGWNSSINFYCRWNAVFFPSSICVGLNLIIEGKINEANEFLGYQFVLTGKLSDT